MSWCGVRWGRSGEERDGEWAICERRGAAHFWWGEAPKPPMTFAGSFRLCRRDHVQGRFARRAGPRADNPPRPNGHTQWCSDRKSGGISWANGSAVLWRNRIRNVRHPGPWRQRSIFREPRPTNQAFALSKYPLALGDLSFMFRTPYKLWP
jgi:hypothetical protein